MTRYAPLWQQGGSYAASLDRGLLSTLWPQGGATGGVVTAVNNTMTVSVAPGTVVAPLQAGQGVALCRWDAAEVVTIAAAPPSGQSRVDVVVAQVRDNALDSGGNNDFVFSAVTGTPAASNPTTPATPTNAYAVANVTVPGAAANLNAATITDRRGALAVAGTLLAVTKAQPVTQVNLTIGGGAYSMTDMAVTFVAPASGRVRARWSGLCAPGTNATLMLAFFSAGAQVGSQSLMYYGAAVTQRMGFEDVVSGLTPGGVYTFTPNAWSGNAVASSISYGGPGNLGNGTSNAGPAITEIFAA
jgi:hypothetical protein